MDVFAALLVGVLAGVAFAALLRRPATPVAAPAEPAALPGGLLGTVLDLLGAGAVVVDRAGAVVLANPAAAAMRVVRGGRLAMPDLTRLVRVARRDGTGAAREVELADGRVVAAQAAPAGDSGWVVLLLDDVTEARLVDAVRRDFVANVSHELKTPVGALALLAEAIHDGEGDPETVRRFAARMLHEASRLSRLVQELIDLSRLQGAEARPAGEPVHVGRIVGEALDRSRLAADARAIEVAAGGELHLYVDGDERQLVTALSNLLDNAVAYSPPGTRVSVGARLRDGEVELSVKDEGIGIAADDVERIFERFYRADPARSRETGGTGLGLAIVKHIATNHGGRVTVWSAEGLGSTFTLHLPVSTGVRAAHRRPA